ncbi:MAG: type IV pili twitching motility protein PilT, partial [Gammaproteobacteria bacterium]|nr:type IV pili twitching motility protein PilT [Gammaproteobacteria bacterium]
METPINNYLQLLAEKDGSDLYLSTDAPPCGKFQGILKPLSKTAYKPGEIEAIAQAIMDAE